ncbi:MAG: NRDE family protein [Bacteroidales bacterium]
MCTLTYIPSSEHDFYFTHSRDENPKREFASPSLREMEMFTVVSPKDLKAGGTWIMASTNRVACILNGAFEKHTPNPPYKHSRGIILDHLFSFKSFSDFLREYDFKDLENFTLICWEDSKLYVLRWNGLKLFFKKLDPKKPYIFSSSTLYDRKQKELRKSWFSHWLNHNPKPSLEDILDFHLEAGDGNKSYSLRMKRGPILETLCVSSVYLQSSGMNFYYQDLLKDTEYQLEIPELLKEC